jgi:hypothetical protein
MLKVDLIIIAIEAPLLIGIYENGNLIEKIENHQQTSEALPLEFEKILKKYKIEKIGFANGPGSFMAIKINYIFLRTISAVLGIELLSQNGFFFNSNSPIRAMNKLYFVQKENSIEMEKIENPNISNFLLPEKFEIDKFSKNIDPIYILPFL